MRKKRHLPASLRTQVQSLGPTRRKERSHSPNFSCSLHTCAWTCTPLRHTWEIKSLKLVLSSFSSSECFIFFLQFIQGQLESASATNQGTWSLRSWHLELLVNKSQTMEPVGSRNPWIDLSLLLTIYSGQQACYSPQGHRTLTTEKRNR